MSQHVSRRRFLVGSLGTATATMLAPRGWIAPASAAEALARLQGGEVSIESTPDSGARVEVTFHVR